MKWYAESVRESDVIDTYMKLFVTLNIFVPHHTAFAEHGADLLSEQFANAKRRHIRACLGDLWNIRNALFHQGEMDRRLPAATQMLQRIVRAMLRRKIGLDDEFVEEADLFKKVAEYTPGKNQGGVFGWPIPPVSKP